METKNLTSLKGHNSVTNVRKMMCSNLVNINVYAKFDKILSICSKDIERKIKSEINEGPYLDLVNINAHTKSGQIISISSQDIERK